MSEHGEPFPFCDFALARRIERAEAESNVAFVEARARLFPHVGAQWVEVGGTYALFDGVDSPLTQTFGLGLFQPPTPTDLDRIETFFRDIGAPVFHEISPLADPAHLGLLAGRGYHPIELTTILVRLLRGGPIGLPAPGDIRVRVAGPEEWGVWAQTAARGWSEVAEVAPAMLDLARVSAHRPRGPSFLAELDGRPVATGAMAMYAGVAVLAGASTIPEARRRGAQLALLDARLRYALDHGCDLAVMGAQPGTGSQRNAERQGFRVAYTRIKWRLSDVARNDPGT
ncbi:MAG TPA: GNAT family N-acetyltransferase [Gemmataceae bacterium]|nr:GNAT family N-acetyltransferase [Gemmataceae bacterium]